MVHGIQRYVPGDHQVFERYLKNKEEDTVVNDVKRKILMEFYNKRDLILKNKNQG